MNRTIRVMAIAEIVIAIMIASIILVDWLEIAGPDSAFTGVLGLLALAIAIAAIACFVFCLPSSVRQLISAPSERTPVQILVVALAALFTFAVGLWLMHIFPHVRPR